MYKAGFLLISLLAGCLAGPLSSNVSLFDHTNLDARIVGGTPAAVGSVPYMVALSIGHHVRSFQCGASLLSARTVLTAAHCVVAAQNPGGSLYGTFTVIVGTNQWRSGGQEYGTERSIKHEQYDPHLIKNDIALVFTASNVAFSSVVRPVSPGYDFVGAGVPVRAAGWGLTQTHGTLSEILLELRMTTVEGQRCAQEVAAKAAALHMHVPPVDDQAMLCAGHSVHHGMCNGDSGSALVRLDNGQQVGIVSWGVPCAQGAPDVFTRVSTYSNWIRSHMV